ncbi:hypothetical protein ABC382_00820 [Lysinibacillus sp. 1P01SD]|uniref:hypothetical protein n=1 Tax=Lysinibacillus sp. 1P01SD TaxID=3132285 RepID=UPI0039A167EA
MILFKLAECTECKGNGTIDLAPCQNCGEEKFIEVPLNKEDIVFVNVYLVTRKFGGHEEGGWYYDHYVCVENFPIKLKFSQLIRKKAISDFAVYKRGDIYSANGGLDVRVLIEDLPRKSETKEKPIYE